MKVRRKSAMCRKEFAVSSFAAGRRYHAGAGLAVLLLLLNLAGRGEALHMSALKIPEHVQANQSVTMECDYDLDGVELQSVKWYKDGREFYRYVPRDEHGLPGVKLFDVKGVQINMKKSKQNSVVLSRVSQESSGRYRCEVSAEAPSFLTVSDHADMLVVVLPENGPKITGGKAKYQNGDLVRVNCTSPPSKPPAKLMWYVNDKEVDPQFLKGPRVYNWTHGLEKSQLGLEFKVTMQLLILGDVRLKCVAMIASNSATMYKRSHDLRIHSDESFVKQPMETRAQSHARSDPTNGSSIVSISLAIFVLFCMSFHG